MAYRNIIRIDEEKCDGCGICARACHEGAIRIIDGKAKLVKESYCDGLGDCIGECPQDAITIEQREAEEYDAEAVEQAQKKQNDSEPAPACQCQGTMVKTLERGKTEKSSESQPSLLSNWPVQIKLLPVNAPYFDGASLLIAADCVPCAFGSFHSQFVDGRVVLLGCPKLDDAKYYEEKLTQIFAANDIKDISIVFMEVPCCTGLIWLVESAIEKSGKQIPVTKTKIGINGNICNNQNSIFGELL